MPLPRGHLCPELVGRKEAEPEASDQAWQPSLPSFKALLSAPPRAQGHVPPRGLFPGVLQFCVQTVHWNGCFQDVWLDGGVRVAFLEILSWERSDRSWICLNWGVQLVWTDFRKQDLMSKRTQTYVKIRNSSNWEPPVLQPKVTSESPSELLAQFQGDVKGISLGTL